MNNILLEILLIGPPILFAITIHEFAHGFIADKLGDPTARLSGRLTLNPLAHLDIIGTLMFFIIHIGWAKPVPVNPNNLQNPRKDMIWVALAGPVSNLICGFIFGMLIRGMFFGGLSLFPPEQWGLAIQVLQIVVIINIILAVFNAIPIFPLDGYRILTGFLPVQQAYKFSRFAKYGPFVLLAIILIGQTTGFPIFWMIIGIPVQILYSLFTGQQSLPI
ncbi:MAG: site-2 protease family protein [Nitrospirota bacterium]